jgi:hypothetical protein
VGLNSPATPVSRKPKAEKKKPVDEDVITDCDGDGSQSRKRKRIRYPT